jgi:hypothetical protein
MYCAQCGTPLTQGISYCNRCGVNLKESRTEISTGTVSAFLTAITLIAVCGLGLMFGGALVLRKGANLSQELIGCFMLFTFLTVTFTEFALFRNFSKLTGEKEKKQYLPALLPQDLRLTQGMPLGEPVSSVTENTTRTLEYIRREQ